jgi:hypothetical protein
MRKKISLIPVKPMGNERFVIFQYRTDRIDHCHLVTSCTNSELDDALDRIKDARRNGVMTKKAAPSEGSAA